MRLNGSAKSYYSFKLGGKNEVRLQSLGFGFKKTGIYHHFKKIELQERGVIDDSQLNFFHYL